MTKEIFQEAQGPVANYILTFVKKSKTSNSWDVEKESYIKDISEEDLHKIMEDWKSQTNDRFDYDVRVKKDK